MFENLHVEKHRYLEVHLPMTFIFCEKILEIKFQKIPKFGNFNFSSNKDLQTRHLSSLTRQLKTEGK